MQFTQRWPCGTHAYGEVATHGCQMLIDDSDCLKIFEAVFIHAQKGCIIAPIQKNKNEKFISSNRSCNDSRGLQ